MGANIVSIGLLLVLGGLLLAAGIEDARRRTIANGLNATVALLAPRGGGRRAMRPGPTWRSSFSSARSSSWCSRAAFAFGMMGGGDVKLIAALALWLPVGPFLTLLLVMSVAGGAVTALMIVERRLAPKEGVLEIPYGVAIAFAGLLALREPILNQLS